MNTDDTQTMNPNNATGAADALTPPGPSEYEPDDERQRLLDSEQQRPEWGTPAYDGGPNANPLEHVDDNLDADANTATFEPIEVNERTVGAPAPVVPVITAELINTAVRNVRAPFEAKKKRGAEFKGARARLDKRADQAVREFRAAHLSELSDEQALAISRGDAGIVGDSMHGFSYVEGA